MKLYIAVLVYSCVACVIVASTTSAIGVPVLNVLCRLWFAFGVTFRPLKMS